MEGRLLGVVNAACLQPRRMSEWTDNDLLSRKMFDVLETCDGVQGDKMVHDQVRTSRPAGLWFVTDALFANGIPLL
jgi:hypothetical protein